MQGLLHSMQRLCWSSYDFLLFLSPKKLLWILSLSFISFFVSKEALYTFYRIGRKLEAKDAARGALKSPWWTLGCRYQAWAAQIISLYQFIVLCCFFSSFLDFTLLRLESIQDVTQIAQWEDEQIEYMKEKRTEEGRKEDLNKGKEPAQVSFCFICWTSLWSKLLASVYVDPCLSNLQIALDEAAFLLQGCKVARRGHRATALWASLRQPCSKICSAISH